MSDKTDVYKFENIPKLTEEQEQSPLARFYYEPVRQPDAAVLEAVGEKQMSVDDIVPFDQIERLISKDSESLKCGWCMLPDGTSYSHMITYMPDVTPEMVEWWNKWIFNPDYDYLNYRIWMPSLHFKHTMPIVEDIGWGPCDILMFQPITTDMLNLSAPPTELDPDFLTLMGCSASATTLDGSVEDKYYVLFTCIKRFGEGVKIQNIVYLGVKWEDGKLIKVHDADPETARLIVTHNAYEFGREAQLAPVIFEFEKTLSE